MKLWISILILSLLILIVVIGIEENVVGETPCVDGLNRVNLGGIMCEDIEDTWFGVNQLWAFLILIPAIFILWWELRR